jgi:hypothetical protein
MLTYNGPAGGADASGVPPVLQFRSGGGVYRSAPCLAGPAGLAAVHVDALPPEAPGATVAIAVRAYGDAGQEVAKLRGLITGWNGAGRTGTGQLRIDAYPAGAGIPDTGGSVFTARHTTFVVSDITAGISDTTSQISDTTDAISDITSEISDTTEEISDITGGIPDGSGEISDTTAGGDRA